MTGDNAEAERRLKAAYEADRNTLRIVDAYARMEASLGRTDLAIQAYSDFDQLSPRHPLVRDALDKLKDGKPLHAAWSPPRRRAPPRCCTGWARPAPRRATSCPR